MAKRKALRSIGRKPQTARRAAKPAVAKAKADAAVKAMRVPIGAVAIETAESDGVGIARLPVAAPAVLMPTVIPQPPPRVAVAELTARARNKRVVLIEGDSWYHFPVPFADALHEQFRDAFGYNTDLHFATAGATIRGMIYGNRRRDLSGVLDALERVKPRVMLFSGGGNDIVGYEFASYLNHRMSGGPPLRQDFATLQMNELFLPAYRHLITQVRVVSPDTKIFVHGYAHAYPNGKAVDLAFLDDLGIVRVGPWMKPALDANGWDATQGRQAVIQLIDMFNGMLAGLEQEFAGTFYHVDLRSVVTRESDWRDELHLRNPAFRRCAQAIHDRIAAVVPGW